MNPPLDFPQFVDKLGSSLRENLPPGIGPDDDLWDRLGLDSLRAFELAVLVEMMVDDIEPPPEPPKLTTLAEAFAYYRTLHDSSTTRNA